MIKHFTVEMLVGSAISNTDSGESLLNLLRPDLSPEQYDNEEPIRLLYDPDSHEQVLKKWHGFLWTRKRKPKLLGMIGNEFREAYCIHDAITIIFKAPKQYDHERIRTLFRDVDDEFGIVFAFAHAAVPQDLDDMRFYARHTQRFSQGLSTHQLREGLPGLAWVTLFGEPYTTLFGDKLATVPAHKVEAIGNTTCIQLTEKPQDVADNYDSYMQARANAIAHLDSGAFTTLDADAPNIPKFPGLD